MARKVNMHEAKTHLSRLVDAAAAGEEIVIARNGKPAARLVKVEERPAKRPGYGMGRGKGRIPTWEQWQDMDRELLAELEASLNDPDDPIFWPPERTQ
ncbi:MAG TPA: type II toxin-antitoxin system prevent-host-death family antitoxin [Capillimicrobium sp.]|jgi:prevent-host-death family protein